MEGMKTIFTLLALTLLGIAIVGSGSDHGSKQEFSKQIRAAQKLAGK